MGVMNSVFSLQSSVYKFFFSSFLKHPQAYIALNLVAMQMGNDMSPLSRGSVNLEDQLTSLVTMINGGGSQSSELGRVC